MSDVTSKNVEQLVTDTAQTLIESVTGHAVVRADLERRRYPRSTAALGKAAAKESIKLVGRMIEEEIPDADILSLVRRMVKQMRADMDAEGAA